LIIGVFADTYPHTRHEDRERRGCSTAAPRTLMICEWARSEYRTGAESGQVEAALRRRKAATRARFWQVIEQKRRWPAGEASM